MNEKTNQSREEILSLISQLESIKSSINELLTQEIKVAIGPFLLQRILGIVQSYQDAVRFFYSILPLLRKRISISLPTIAEEEARTNPLVMLERLKHTCEFMIVFLEQQLYDLSQEEVDRLRSLANELNTVKDFNLSLYLHLESALKEYENHHYLSTTVLSGKVISFVLEQIPGKDDSEKIKELVKHGIVDENMEAELLRGARRARDYYTHDINAIPRSDEALDMLAKAFQFTRFLMELSKKK